MSKAYRIYKVEGFTGFQYGCIFDETSSEGTDTTVTTK